MASCTSRGGVLSRNADADDLHAPPLGHLIELRTQDLVDLLALRQHVVEEDVADHGAECRRRDARDGRPEVLDLEDGVGGLLLHHLLVDQEVDRDGRVVLGDAGLLRDLDYELTQVDVEADLDRRRQQEHQARAGHLLIPPERQDHEALVLRHDVDDRAQDEDHDDCREDRDGKTDIHQDAPLPGDESLGSTIRLRPSLRFTRTWLPFGIAPLSLRADPSSPPPYATPFEPMSLLATPVAPTTTGEPPPH